MRSRSRSPLRGNRRGISSARALGLCCCSSEVNKGLHVQYVVRLPASLCRRARRSTCTSVATVCLLLLAGCGGTGRGVTYMDLTRQAGSLEFPHLTRDVFRERAALLAVLARNNPGRTIRLPAIDFQRRELYLVAAG